LVLFRTRVRLPSPPPNIENCMEIIEKETQKNIKILKMGKKLERPLAQIQDILIELEDGPVVIEDTQLRDFLEQRDVIVVDVLSGSSEAVDGYSKFVQELRSLTKEQR